MKEYISSQTSPTGTYESEPDFGDPHKDMGIYQTQKDLRADLVKYWAPRLKYWLEQDDAVNGTTGQKTLATYGGLKGIMNSSTAQKGNDDDNDKITKNLGLIYVNLLGYRSILK